MRRHYRKNNQSEINDGTLSLPIQTSARIINDATGVAVTTFKRGDSNARANLFLCISIAAIKLAATAHIYPDIILPIEDSVDLIKSVFNELCKTSPEPTEVTVRKPLHLQ